MAGREPRDDSGVATLARIRIATLNARRVVVTGDPDRTVTKPRKPNPSSSCVLACPAMQS